MSTRNRIEVLGVALCLALAVACTQAANQDSTGDGEPVAGGNLIDYQNWSAGPADHIDPALAQSTQEAQIGHLLFDGLTDYDYRTGRLEKALAETYSPNADATVWTFKLRPGVRFSNGDPVLPSDFKYGWERAAGKRLASPIAYHLTDNARIRGMAEVAGGTTTEASGVRADDAAGTLTVELEAPLSFFPDVVAHPVFSPVPRKVVSALPDPAKWEQGVMVGNGPFTMTEPWKPDQGVRLARNPTYWGGIHGHAAYLDSVDFRVSRDVESAWAAFEAGQGQTGLIPPGRYADAANRYPGRIATQEANGLYFYEFNMRDPTVGGPQNAKLRQAMSLAIDRQRIVTDVFDGSRRVAQGITPPGVLGFTSGIGNYSTRDLPRARRLLEEWQQASGKKPGDIGPIKLNFGAGAGHDAIATIIQQNLQEIGIRSELDPWEPRTYVGRLRKGEGQFFRLGWAADYNSYDNMLWPLFGEASGDNLGRYSNPRFDQMIDSARRTTDDGKRYDSYRQAESIVLNDDTAAVPLNWYAGTIAWSDRLHGVVQSQLLFVAYDQMWMTR